MIDEQTRAEVEAKRIAGVRAGHARRAAEKAMPEEERRRLLEEKRVRNFQLGKQRQKERTQQRKALAKAQKEQDADYPRLTPQQWKAKYGSEKPMKGLIDEASAVRIVSRRMTAVALHTLAQICEDSTSDAARVSAAKEILDRGWGKAHLAPQAETRPGSEITVVFGNQRLLDQVNEPAEEEEDDDDGEEEDPAVLA